MRFDEYRKQDATALARLFAKGEVSVTNMMGLSPRWWPRRRRVLDIST